jgi:hypothetical protein
MSNTNIKNTATNQALLMDLNEKDAETINGGQLKGSEIKNLTNKSIDYTVDGEKYITNPKNDDFIAYERGQLRFKGGQKQLEDGRIYAFKPSNGGIGLYDVGEAWQESY